MRTLPVVLIWIAAVLGGYAYLGYPLALLLRRRFARRQPGAPQAVERWPKISVVIAVHNRAAVIREALEAVLASDYPRAQRQVLVVSDASTDGTEDVVRRFADHGVELLRLPQRRGKTGAENAARARLRGEIIVHADAAVTVDSRALRLLVAALEDPAVGVASAREVSLGGGHARYETWVRDLETGVSGIVSASGYLYAIRAELYNRDVPDELSRDLAAVLEARRRGYRAVSVPQAGCSAPTATLREEYRRRVRTIARGIATLARERWALDPRRAGVFAWLTFSHLVCRWLLPPAALAALASLVPLRGSEPWARYTLFVAAGLAALAALGRIWPRRWRVPRLVAWPASVVWGAIAVLHAMWRVLRGRATALWEPARRGGEPSPAPPAKRPDGEAARRSQAAGSYAQNGSDPIGSPVIE